MACSKKDLLNLCVSEIPTKEVTLSNGLEVKIKSLTGAESMRMMSIDNFDERVEFALPKALVAPKLSGAELTKLINRAPTVATEIMVEIYNITEEMASAASEGFEDAKKNSKKTKN